jgi:hypothetical protein
MDPTRSSGTGRPREGADRLLAGLRDASRAGVAFPLSATHYMESLRVTSSQRRTDVARVMSEISHCGTLRSRHALMRHQFLCAMHKAFGHPAFMPLKPEPLGVGVHWAFKGEQHRLNVHGPNGAIVSCPELFLWESLCRAMQWAEVQFLAGPHDNQIELLRQRYGYRPESTDEVSANRLEWEQIHVDLLASNHAISREELRVRVEAREAVHEHLDRINEYHLPFGKLIGSIAAVPGNARERFIAFIDSIPSARLAVDLKVELIRNQSNTWTVNDLHDIDALSLAIPYCHVVVGDKATVDAVRRSGGDVRNRTTVISKLVDLLDFLPDLQSAAEALGSIAADSTGTSPGSGSVPSRPKTPRASSTGVEPVPHSCRPAAT